MRGSPTPCAARPTTPRAPPPELRTPALDRLLWVFLRLLLSQQAIERFLKAADGEALTRTSATTCRRARSAAAAGKGRRADHPLDRRQHRDRRAAPGQLREGGVERRVHRGRARPHREQDPGARPRWRSATRTPTMSRPGRRGRRRHRADRADDPRAAERSPGWRRRRRRPSILGGGHERGGAQ